MRIISGMLRGRDLGAVPPGVRPTTDRVRESLFASLGVLEEARVLDLFAGTGALGLEAYSRGAARVVFVERSRRVGRALERRLDALGLGETEALSIVQCAADVALRRLRERDEAPFDLAFLDPPYEEGSAETARETTLQSLLESGLLQAHATVVVEGPTRHPLAPVPGARVTDERRYGDTLLTWLTPSPSKAAAGDVEE